MTEQEILNSNKLIAEFMGAKFNWNNIPDDCWLPVHGVCRCDKIGLGNGKILEYHKSYDWIIPVAEKIYDMECSSAVFKHQTMLAFKASIFDIKTVFDILVEFIIWFNRVDKK